jgi:aryl-alcohol dehydrogenase-like predicted oxidoreductase
MQIEKRRLGKSRLDVTAMGLGLWAMGGADFGPTEDRQSLNTIDAALDAGVTFFDTADVYGDGHSERLLGQAMRGRRERFIVATKIGWQGYDDAAQRSQYDDPAKIVAGVEGSLQRLGTDYVDLLQWHIDRQDETMQTALEGFRQLKQSGKVRAFGLSTSDFDYLQAFNAEGDCATLQVDYSILNRTPEAEIFPYCQEQNIGVIVRGPLAMGILTGKFSAQSRFPEGDFRRNWIDNPDENRIFTDDLAKVTALQPLAQDRTLAQLALQFSFTHPAVSTTIPGAKTVAQLQDNLKAAELGTLPTEDMAVIDGLVPPGAGRKIWPA